MLAIKSQTDIVERVDPVLMNGDFTGHYFMYDITFFDKTVSRLFFQVPKHALHACLACMPCMHALHEALHEALHVCLTCMPYMYALLSFLCTSRTTGMAGCSLATTSSLSSDSLFPLPRVSCRVSRFG